VLKILYKPSTKGKMYLNYWEILKLDLYLQHGPTLSIWAKGHGLHVVPLMPHPLF